MASDTEQVSFRQTKVSHGQRRQVPFWSTRAAAYKQVQLSYNEMGQLTYVIRPETPTSTESTPSLRTVLDYDADNWLASLRGNDGPCES